MTYDGHVLHLTAQGRILAYALPALAPDIILSAALSRSGGPGNRICQLAAGARSLFALLDTAVLCWHGPTRTWVPVDTVHFSYAMKLLRTTPEDQGGWIGTNRLVLAVLEDRPFLCELRIARSQLYYQPTAEEGNQESSQPERHDADRYLLTDLLDGRTQWSENLTSGDRPQAGFQFLSLAQSRTRLFAGVGMGEWGGHVAVFEANADEPALISDSLGYPTGLALHPQRPLAVSWSMSHMGSDGVVRLHPEGDVEPTAAYASPEDPPGNYIHAVAYAPDGKLFAVQSIPGASPDGQLVMRNDLQEIVGGSCVLVASLGPLRFPPGPHAVGHASAVAEMLIPRDRLFVLRTSTDHLLAVRDTATETIDEAGTLAAVDACLAEADRTPPVVTAAAAGDFALVRALVAGRAAADRRAEDLGSALHAALANGHWRLAAYLVDTGAPVNHRDLAGQTPLHLATAHEASGVSGALLARGADISARNWQDETPLSAAARLGNHHLVRELLAHGANPNVALDQGHGLTPLHLAIQARDHASVAALIDAGADVNHHDNRYQESPLFAAALAGDEVTVRLLLASGARTAVPPGALAPPITAGPEGLEAAAPRPTVFIARSPERLAEWETAMRPPSPWVTSPLHAAVAAGSARLVDLLLARHMNPDEAVGNERIRPLHVAAAYGHRAVAACLLAHGADPEAADSHGNTALRWAADLEHQPPPPFPVITVDATRQGREATAVLLLEHGADRRGGLSEESDSRWWRAGGWQPLHLAARNGWPRLVTALVRRGANMEAADAHGLTAVHLAAEAGHEEVLHVLRAQGADLAAVSDKSRETALHLVTDPATAKYLLDHGLDPNLPDAKGMVPLHRAVIQRNLAVAMLLIGRGAKVSIARRDGATPLHLAAVFADQEMAALLLANGADPNARDHAGTAPLTMAFLETDDLRYRPWYHEQTEVDSVNSRRLPMATFLLQHGADIHARDNEGLTVLSRVVWEEAVPPDTAVAFLLKAGAQATTADKQGETPLHRAVFALHRETCLALIRAGADVNATATHSVRPIHIAAAASESWQMTELLLNAGAQLDAWTDSGLHPLHKAALADPSDSLAAAPDLPLNVKFLLSKGVDVNLPSRQRAKTALHLACEHNRRVYTAQYLLAHGADMNKPDADGNTPLHLAVTNMRPQIVALLINSGCRRDVRNAAGKTPEDIWRDLPDAKYNRANADRKAVGEPAQSRKTWDAYWNWFRRADYEAIGRLLRGEKTPP